MQDLVLQAMTSAVSPLLGLGLKARSKSVPLALHMSGLGREGLLWFSLFGLYINLGMPSDSDDMRQLSWCSSWTL